MQMMDRKHPAPGVSPTATFAKKVAVAVSITLALLIVVLLVWYGRTVMLLVFAGILVGIFLQWGKRGLMRYLRLPGFVALALLLLFLIAVFGVMLGFMVPIVIEQAFELARAIPEAIDKARGWLYRFGWERLLPTASDSQENAGEMLLGENREEMMDALKDIVGIFSTTFGAFFGMVVIMVIGIYISADHGLYIQGVLRLLPERRRPRAIEVMGSLAHVLRWWLLGQSVSMLILGSTVFVGLRAIGIPNAMVLAVFTAIMTFIPNLGPLIAFIPIALTTMTVGTVELVYVGIFYLFIQNLEGFFITPMIHRKVITMPPVLILATQVLLFELAGFLGVLLAVPLLACAMVLTKLLYIEDVLDDPSVDAGKLA
jgi:predicted PurR-regulated permease PerM